MQSGSLSRMDRLFVFFSAIAGLTTVAAGAFGAHVLKGRLSSELFAVFQTAVLYQMFHALALLACAWVVTRWPGRAATAAGWMFMVGMVVFSGSLYLIVLGAPRWFGAITPLGGTALMLGWICVAWAALKGGR